MEIDASCPKCGTAMVFKYAHVVDDSMAVIDVDCPDCNTMDSFYIEVYKPPCSRCEAAPAGENGLCEGCEVARAAYVTGMSHAWCTGYLGYENPYEWMSCEWHEWKAGIEAAINDEARKVADGRA